MRQRTSSTFTSTKLTHTLSSHSLLCNMSIYIIPFHPLLFCGHFSRPFVFDVQLSNPSLVNADLLASLILAHHVIHFRFVLCSHLAREAKDCRRIVYPSTYHETFFEADWARSHAMKVREGCGVEAVTDKPHCATVMRGRSVSPMCSAAHYETRPAASSCSCRAGVCRGSLAHSLHLQHPKVVRVTFAWSLCVQKYLVSLHKDYHEAHVVIGPLPRTALKMKGTAIEGNQNLKTNFTPFFAQFSSGACTQRVRLSFLPRSSPPSGKSDT